MKNLLAFLSGWLIAAILLVPQAHAAVVVTPSVSGYAGGMYKAAATSFTMAAANDGFVAQAVANVGGRAVTMPATLRMAANAGKYALEGMRLTPAGIVGTLAAAWLLDKGMEYINGQWQVAGLAPGTGVSGGRSWTQPQYGYGCDDPSQNCTYEQAVNAFLQVPKSNPNYSSVQYGGVVSNNGTCSAGQTCSVTFSYSYLYHGAGPYTANNVVTGYDTGNTATSGRPATQSDWDALPDPLPSVAPELPYAPYLPEGVPVTPPEYQPSDLPLGDPYTKPDGSTWQQRAKFSPGQNGQVTVAPYEEQVTDPQGNPVNNPTPQPTNDPQQDPCEGHADRLGCADMGTPPAGEDMPRDTKNITFAPLSIAANATCPAPITFNAFGKSMQIDYAPACTYASGIKPVVIAVGYLTAAFIIFGIPRSQT